MWDKEKQDFLEQLYRDHAESLRLYSYALLGKQPEFLPLAEDCVQQTFLKAMRQIQSLRQHGAPYLWLYKTCQYTTLTEMKTLKRRAKILQYPASVEDNYEIADPKDHFTEWIVKEDIQGLLTTLVVDLTDQEYAVYTVSFLEAKSILETAVILNVSEGSVRGARQRIRHKLRCLIKAYLCE